MKVGDIIKISYTEGEYLVEVTRVNFESIFHDGLERYGKLTYGYSWNINSSFSRDSPVGKNAVVIQES